MIFTLHRYVFRELLKVFIVTVVALTVMLSVGIILRPVQKYGVGPAQVFSIMGYFLPVTLTFVLPVAALFAGSLVYGRLAADNELDACRASGISLLSLLQPGLMLALIVAIANLLLSFHVMPVFVHRAEKSIKADAKQILFRNIQRRGYFRLPPDEQYLIYADRADPQHNTLAGVVVVKMEPTGIRRVITARTATILFQPHRRFNEVTVIARNACQMDAQSSYMLGSSSFTTEFGSLLADDIKFKKLREMKRIRDVDPMLFDPIAKLANSLYRRLIAELLAADIRAKATRAASALYELHSGRRIIKFSAADCEVSDEGKVELSGEVLVRQYDALSRKLLRTMRCRRALLGIEGDHLTPTLVMDLYSPSWENAAGETQSAWGWVRTRGLVLPDKLERIMDNFRTGTTLNVARLAECTSIVKNVERAELDRLCGQLKWKIADTLAEIEAEMHSRLAFGVGCVPMIMIGIALGIILKGGHLLTAFGASCIPAAVLMVAVLMGKNIAKNPGAPGAAGIAAMWVGFGLLVLLALTACRRVLKN